MHNQPPSDDNSNISLEGEEEGKEEGEEGEEEEEEEEEEEKEEEEEEEEENNDNQWKHNPVKKMKTIYTLHKKNIVQRW